MRLDNYLVEKGYFDSRTKAKQSILRGEIFINGQKTDKPSLCVEQNVKVERVFLKNFVSLGGFKLQKAIEDFGFSVKDYTCVDLGASTGGFTDALLQNGAKKVYSVDLNDSLLHQSIKKDKRVVPIIKNARFLARSDFNEDINLITADLSFISEKYILPIMSNIIDDGKYIIVLIKPQFETDRKIKFKNGIIKDVKIRKEVVKRIFDCAINNGLSPLKITSAPISKDKNTEYLLLLRKGNYKTLNIDDMNF